MYSGAASIQDMGLLEPHMVLLHYHGSCDLKWNSLYSISFDFGHHGILREWNTGASISSSLGAQTRVRVELDTTAVHTSRQDNMTSPSPVVILLSLLTLPVKQLLNNIASGARRRWKRM